VMSCIKLYQIHRNLILHNKNTTKNSNIFCLHINLKHFCLSCGIRVLNSIESARYCVFNNGVYPKTWNHENILKIILPIY